MASSKKKLGKYIEGRKVKYRHPYQLLFHTSISPRKILHPHITSCQHDGDSDRMQPLVFLCPFSDIKTWLDWVFRKYPQGKQEMLRKRLLDKNAFVTLFVHIVRVDPKELSVPQIRYGHEFIVKNALCPVAVVPIRYYPGRTPNLGKVASCMQKIKEDRHPRSRLPNGGAWRKGQGKIRRE